LARLVATIGLGMALSTQALSQASPTGEQAQRSARLAAFRTFAVPYLGEWDCLVEDYDAAGKTVWSDRQRRIFAFTMSRHFLEERAILKRPDGTEYEGGLHLMTWDPRSDRVVQHGFWLPRQPDPLFRVEGRVKGQDFAGDLHIKEESGATSIKGFTMRWAGADRWLLETQEKRPDGQTFVSSRVTYTRVAKKG
jgi:hypothetical protein